MGDCPKEYLEFVDREAEMLEEWNKNEKTIKDWYPDNREDVQKKQLESINKEGVVVLKNFRNDPFHKPEVGKKWKFYYRTPSTRTVKAEVYVDIVAINNEDKEKRTCDLSVKKCAPPKETKIQEYYKTFDKFVKDYHGYDKKDSKTGKYGYWENPNAKWDWYSLGGRWTGFFKLKPGRKGESGTPGLMTSPAEVGFVDQAYKRDIDFETMKEESFEKAMKTYDEFEAKFKEDPKCKTFNAYFEYGVYNKGSRTKFVPETRQEFLLRQAPVLTFAVIKDGKWYERGKMGWWACVSDEKAAEDWNAEYAKLLDEVSEDTQLSIFDCHI